MRDEKLRLLALCGYPSDRRPTHQPFVRALLRALAGQGAEPCVLAPESAAIGAAIAALVDRPAERAKLAAAALAHASAFSLERRADRILALLRGVASA
jgi:glycosyltransferase involved in cell wall biosynthesis